MQKDESKAFFVRWGRVGFQEIEKVWKRKDARPLVCSQIHFRKSVHGSRDSETSSFILTCPLYVPVPRCRTSRVSGVELEVLDRKALVLGEYFGEESQPLSQSLLCLLFLGAWLQPTQIHTFTGMRKLVTLCLTGSYFRLGFHFTQQRDGIERLWMDTGSRGCVGQIQYFAVLIVFQQCSFSRPPPAYCIFFSVAFIIRSCVIGVENQLWTVHSLLPLACYPHEARSRVSVALSTRRQAALWQQELGSQQQDVFGETYVRSLLP